MSRPKISIYGDRDSRASYSQLSEAFQVALGPELAARIDINIVTAAQLHDGSATDHDTIAFVLPGIEGEDSLYPAHINERGNGIIRRYVHQGGVFMGLCAGGYYAASKIEYAPEWGPYKERLSGILGLFNGLARGPVPGLGIAPTDETYKGCTTTPIVDEDGIRSEIFYSSGPAFSSVPEGSIVLARYDTKDRPIAAFAARAGRGAIILSGVLPQYSPHPTWKMPPENPTVYDRLCARIKPYEAQRRKLWRSMVREVMNQYVKIDGQRLVF